jgi:hypothetical protein
VPYGDASANGSQPAALSAAVSAHLPFEMSAELIYINVPL